MLISTALAGCGFHLRGTRSEPLLIDSITVVSPNRLTALASAAEDELGASGVTLTDSASGPVLELIEERVQSRPITSSGSGSASQYEVQLEIEYRLLSSGDVLIPPSVLSARRIYSFDRDNLVGNTEEEQILTVEMRRELSQRLVQQINAAIRSAGGDS